jgi:hypothetical protein
MKFWIRNHESGLELGYMIPSPLAGDERRGSSLRINLALKTDLSASLGGLMNGSGQDSQTIIFEEPDSSVRLQCNLQVSDVSGRALPAWFSLSSKANDIVVDGAEAAYHCGSQRC